MRPAVGLCFKGECAVGTSLRNITEWSLMGLMTARKTGEGGSKRFRRKEDESNSVNPKRAIYNSDNYLDMEDGRSMDR